MINRESALYEIMDRVYRGTTIEHIPYKGFELKHFELTPVNPVSSDLMPCILFFEDDDEILKRSTRGNLGFPVVRTLKLMIDVWDFTPEKTKQLYMSTRLSALDLDGHLPTASVREVKTIGPFTTMADSAIGMRLVLAITYTENSL